MDFSKAYKFQTKNKDKKFADKWIFINVPYALQTKHLQAANDEYSITLN